MKSNPRRRWAWCVRVLALFLVPVVVFTTGQNAQAAIYYGGWVHGEFSWGEGGVPGNSGKCSLDARYKVDTSTTPVVQMTGACTVGWLDGIDTMRYVFDGGSGCNFETSAVDLPSPGSFPSGLTAVNVGPYDRALCNVAVGRVVLCNEPWVGETECMERSFTIALGVPPDGTVAATCPRVTSIATPYADAPTVTYTTGPPPLGGRSQLTNYSFTPGATGAGSWRVYSVVKPLIDPSLVDWTQSWKAKDATSAGVSENPNSVTGLQLRYKASYVTGVAGVPSAPTYYAPVAHHWSSGPGVLAGQVIGLGMYWAPGDGSWADTTPQANVKGIIGTTDPARCSFYWGEKVATVAASTIDEPIGALGGVDPGTPSVTPPAGDGDDKSAGCGFSWTDPSTYASAGICKLVGLVGQMLDTLGKLIDGLKDVVDAVLGLAEDIAAAIAGALGGLAGAIADAVADALGGIVDLISDMLSALFVPGDGFMQGEVNDMQDAWDDTPPVVLAGGVEDVGDAMHVGSPGSSCAGPAWNIPNPLGADQVGHPFSSCSGAMGTVASLIRTALTIGVYVGGFLAAARVIGASLGLDLSFGKGDDV